MDNNWKEEDLADAKAVTDEVTEEAIAEEKQADTPARKRRTWPWMLLFLLIAAAAFVRYAPEPMRDRYLSPLMQWLPDAQREIVKSPPPKKEPEAAPAPKPPVAPPEAAAKPAPATIERIVPASSDEINRVLSAMTNLQGELTTLRQQQQQLEQQQRAVQLMQLRTRLNWISNPANHLPQLQLAWEEVSLMPVLSEDERKQAQSMLKLAQQSMQKLQGWQQVLRRSAESLTRVEHDNIIPKFEYGWLNWIVGQFSIRPSLSREEADDAALRQALINTSRNLEMEVWPQKREWLELRAKLQLRMLADEKGNESEGGKAIDLPESFDAIRADIATLRSSAAVWLERL